MDELVLALTCEIKISTNYLLFRDKLLTLLVISSEANLIPGLFQCVSSAKYIRFPARKDDLEYVHRGPPLI